MGLSVQHHICPTEAVRRWVRRETGIALHAGAEPFERRLQRIRDRSPRLEDLALALDDPSETSLREEIIDAATTQETSWFREPTTFDALKTLLAERQASGKSLSIWSAGCAFGQEIYSVAMTLAESGGELERTRLLATDIAPHALRRAQAGRYLSLEMARGLPPKLRDAYFQREDGAWVLTPSIRDSVEFRRHDLREPVGERFDIILCRYVLIYFDAASQRQALAELARSLRPGGYLALGNAESLRRMDAPFLKCSVGGATLYRPVPSMYE